MENVYPENVFQTLSLSPYSRWTLAPQLAPEHVEMLADYTTRPEIQERRRGGNSVICAPHNTGNLQRKFQTSLTNEEPETLLGRHLIPPQAHPSLRGDVCPPQVEGRSGASGCIHLTFSQHAECLHGARSCLPWSHDTHLFKYHLVISSMWLLSPCLILMEKDIVAMWKRKGTDKAYQHWQYLPFSWHTMLGVKCYRQNILQNVLFLKPADFYLKNKPQEMKIFQGETKISTHAE